MHFEEQIGTSEAIRNQISTSGRWPGLDAKPEQIPLLLRDLSRIIDRAWEEETNGPQSSAEGLFDIGAYRRVAEKIPEISVNLQSAAFDLAHSNDPDRKEEGRKILLHTSLPTIISAAEKWRGKKIDHDELFERGILASLGVIENYEPKSITPLRQKIFHAVDTEGQKMFADALDVPLNWVQDGLVGNIPSWIDKFRNTYGRLPSSREIAKKFNIKESEIKYQLEGGILLPGPVSKNLVPNDSAEELAVNIINSASLTERINNALLDLEKSSPRNADVLRMRFGIPPYEREYKHDEIAQKYKVTRQRIRQLEKFGLQYLRLHSREQKLRLMLNEL